ncbi:MAG TPA: 2Fe-2S iron-sulfur cluster-binding protein [bacterium]|nr:2Fe-2S iron-sulfur cluster-binding protein [bacterium]
MSTDGKQVTLTIDDRSVTVPRGTTLWEAARELGIDIPVLCHNPRMSPVGVCRMCVVDVGERVLAASCVRPCEEGMKVQTATPEVLGHRRTLTQLLLSDYPEQSRREGTTGDDALLALARDLGVDAVPFPDGATGAPRGQDDSSPVIAVDHQACILCDRCIRACDELQHNDVIGRTGKGYFARIAFDLNNPMGQSTCVACGECMASCPTGALTNKAVAGMRVLAES